MNGQIMKRNCFHRPRQPLLDAFFKEKKMHYFRQINQKFPEIIFEKNIPFRDFSYFPSLSPGDHNITLFHPHLLLLHSLHGLCHPLFPDPLLLGLLLAQSARPLLRGHLPAALFRRFLPLLLLLQPLRLCVLELLHGWKKETKLRSK